jgi:hypothetical protein
MWCLPWEIGLLAGSGAFAAGFLLGAVVTFVLREPK